MANEEEDDDYMFYESDSDSDTEDYTTIFRKHIENNWDDDEKVQQQHQQGALRRKCLEVQRCHKHQHHVEFDGLPLFELFKVKFKLNPTYNNNNNNDNNNNDDNNNSPLINGRLYGKISTLKTINDPDNPDPISYYYVSPNEPDLINLDGENKFTMLVLLSSPNPRPPLFQWYWLGLKFAFKIDDKNIFFNGFEYYGHNPQLFGDDGCEAELLSLSEFTIPNLTRPVVSRLRVGKPSCDRILVGAYYGLYRGSWANIDVKMLKELGDKGFYGFIVARPCIFYSRIRLLTIQRGCMKKKVSTIERDHDGEVDETSRVIKLMRSVVAVPSCSSLIIGALLYDGDEGGELFCRGKIAFVAKESGEETERIFYGGVAILEVRVQWKCQV